MVYEGLWWFLLLYYIILNNYSIFHYIIYILILYFHIFIYFYKVSSNRADKVLAQWPEEQVTRQETAYRPMTHA